MSWIQSHWLALVLFAGYTAVLARHAIAGKRATANVADYYVGGRNMSGLVLGASFFATFCSTNGFVGLAGKSYEFGLPWLLYTVFFVVAALLSWQFIAPRFRQLTGHFDSVTIADFVGARYASPAARTFIALVMIFASVLYMTAIYKGMGNLLQVFLDIPYVTGILLVFVITVAYTAIGGFKSVVRTDVLQGGLMLIAAVVVFYRVTSASGGIGSIADLAASPADAQLFEWDAGIPFALLLGIMAAGSMKLLVEPRQLSRFYALKDRAAIRQGKMTSCVALLVFFTLLLPMGLYARLLDIGTVNDTDLVIPLLLTSGDIFLGVESAFIAVAIIAAAMSSLDSVLLVVAAVCHRDLGSRLMPWTRRHDLAATRVYVIAVAMITAAVAVDPPGDIVEITTLSGSLYAACLTPIMLFGLHSQRGSGAAVIGACIAGIAVLLAWSGSPLAARVHEVFPATLASLATYGLLARVTPPSLPATARAQFATPA